MYDGKGAGEFDSEGKNPKRYKYQIENWVRQGEHPRRRSGKRITEADLPQVDFMIVISHPVDEPKNLTYDTVWGPFDDWDFLEGFLAYDYGDEGSLMQGLAS